MKTYIITFLTVLLSVSGFALTNSLSYVNDSIVTVSDSSDSKILNDDQRVLIAGIDSLLTNDESANENDESEDKVDTIHIRVGRHAVEIINDEEKTRIDVERLDEFESRWEKNEKKDYERRHYGSNKKFDGHWAGIDFGGNQLLKTDYSLYPTRTVDFLETSPEKSFEVNINPFEYSFGFCSYFGIVTGLGINFNDYKFKNRVAIYNDDNGMIQYKDLPEGDFRVSKLSTVFINAPLLIEFQIPGQWDRNRMFITAGVIGGVKISEHTKTQIGDTKIKDKGNHNVAPVRWGYTARIGFENIGIYATLYETKLFEKGMGPETTPCTIGLTFTF